MKQQSIILQFSDNSDIAMKHPRIFWWVILSGKRCETNFLFTHSSIEVEILQILQDSEEMLQQDGSFLEAPHLGIDVSSEDVDNSRLWKVFGPGNPKDSMVFEGPVFGGIIKGQPMVKTPLILIPEEGLVALGERVLFFEFHDDVMMVHGMWIYRIQYRIQWISGGEISTNSCESWPFRGSRCARFPDFSFENTMVDIIAVSSL